MKFNTAIRIILWISIIITLVILITRVNKNANNIKNYNLKLNEMNSEMELTLKINEVLKEKLKEKNVNEVKENEKITELEDQKLINVRLVEEYNTNYMKNLLDYLGKWNMLIKSGKTVFQAYVQLLNDTDNLIIEEQWMPPFIVTKRPVPLSNTLNCQSEIHSKYFNQRKPNNESSYLIDIIMFGYELKLLEIRLYELYDVVDEFIIFESNITFKKFPKKLYFYENMKRFHRFIDKITLMTPFNITRFNKDGSIKISIETDPKDINEEFKKTNQVNIADEPAFYKLDFSLDLITRMLPIKFYEKHIRKFDSNDVFVHGDLDEIPDSDIVNHFKYCEVKKELYPFATWSTFYIFTLNLLFQSDFWAYDDLYSFKYPNILILDDIIKNNITRLQKTTVLPQATGCHLNRILGTIANGIYKEMSQSDGIGVTEHYMEVINDPTIEGYKKFRKTFTMGKIQERWAHRVVKLSSFNGKLKTFMPWIIKENKEAYKSFFE